MLELKWFDLQLFGEGGDGGDGGSAGGAGEGGGNVAGEEIPASIPEKARKHYQKAMQKMPKAAPAPTPEPQPTTEKEVTETHTPYAELIKSDAYKDEHQAYMNKTISERLGKYKGIEEQYGKAKSALDIVAAKYGIDSSAENFLEALTAKIEADDSYYETYAAEHDISTDEAKRVITLERQLSAAEAQKAQAQKQEQMRQQVMLLQKNAEKTKARFPQFDLNTEMQDERFRRLCMVNNGDTTAAYMACHWDTILPATAQAATAQAAQQTAQAIKANQSRPRENGLSSTAAPAVASVEKDFRSMNLKELRAYADEQRRKQKGSLV